MNGKAMNCHVCIADESYARGLAVSLQSLLDSLNHNPGPKHQKQPQPQEELQALHVWLIDCGLLPVTWTKLQQMVQAPNQKPVLMCSFAAARIVEETHGRSGQVSSSSTSHCTTSKASVVQLHRVELSNSSIAGGSQNRLAPIPPGQQQAQASSSSSSNDTNTFGASSSAATVCSNQAELTSASPPADPALDAAPCSTQLNPQLPAKDGSCPDGVVAAGYHLPPCDSYASQCCWLKLLLPELLPPDIDYLLYLDCDVLVKQNICQLLSQASDLFQGCPTVLLAAVRDFGISCGHEGLLQLHDPFSWTPESPYFNAGLLLYNMHAWRQQQQQQKSIRTALLQFRFNPLQPAKQQKGHSAAAPGPLEGTGAGAGAGVACVDLSKLAFHNQDALNLLCCAGAGWVELDFKWHVQRQRAAASNKPEVAKDGPDFNFSNVQLHGSWEYQLVEQVPELDQLQHVVGEMLAEEDPDAELPAFVKLKGTCGLPRPGAVDMQDVLRCHPAITRTTYCMGPQDCRFQSVASINGKDVVEDCYGRVIAIGTVGKTDFVFVRNFADPNDKRGAPCGMQPLVWQQQTKQKGKGKGKQKVVTVEGSFTAVPVAALHGKVCIVPDFRRGEGNFLVNDLV